MPTSKQQLGLFGEKNVVKHCSCPKCKREKTLKTLPPNFKCADLICDFCGYLAQVKTANVKNIDHPPNTILGAAWKPQQERMDAGIYFPLYIVLVNNRKHSIFYLSADTQTPEMFIPRKPLAKTAKRAGWQGLMIDLKKAPSNTLIRLK